MGLNEQWLAMQEEIDNPDWFEDLVYKPFESKFSDNQQWLLNQNQETKTGYSFIEPVFKTPQSLYQEYQAYFRPFDPVDFDRYSERATIKTDILESNLQKLTNRLSDQYADRERTLALKAQQALDKATLDHEQTIARIDTSKRSAEAKAIRTIDELDNIMARTGISTGPFEKQKNIQFQNISDTLTQANMNKLLANKKLEKIEEGVAKDFQQGLDKISLTHENIITQAEAQQESKSEQIQREALTSQMLEYEDWKVGQAEAMKRLLGTDAHIGWHSYSTGCDDPDDKNYNPSAERKEPQFCLGPKDDPNVPKDMPTKVGRPGQITNEIMSDCLATGNTQAQCEMAVTWADVAMEPSWDDTPGGLDEDSFLAIYDAMVEPVQDAVDSCFHPKCKVELEDGTVKMVKEVKYGDKVKAVDKHGNIIYSEVWEDKYFNLKDETQKKYYVTINAGDKTVRLTSMHTIFVNNLKKNMMAKNVKPGMFVNVVDGDEVKQMMVDSVVHGMEVGKYDLYTKEGTVVVDGILTGTLAFYPHKIAQWLHKFVNKHPRLYKFLYKYVYYPMFKFAYDIEEEKNLGKYSLKKAG